MRPFPFHPLLLAAYPVLFLFAQNLTEVALGETYQPILRAAAAAVGVTLVAGLILRDIRRGALIASAVVIVWFAYGYLEDLARPLAPSRDVLLACCVAFVVLVALLAWRLRPSRIAALTTAANVVAVVIVALTLIDIVPYQLSRGTVAATPTDQARPAPAPGSRDIYFLIFDRYGNNEAMRDAAGVDNDLPAWLEGEGFIVAPDARANYGRTTLSLAATLNLTYLDEVAAQMGPDTDDATPVNDMLQDHKVGRYLQEHGYRYIQIGNWFAPTKTSAIADENPQLTAETDFGTLLDDTTLGPTVDELMGIKTPPSHHLLHRAAALFDFHELDRVSAEPGPKFVMMHILLPHEPYVFKANGEYSGLSEADSKFSPAGQAQQLAFTNDRIRGSCELPPRTCRADQQPIILIEADEGPYPDRYSRDQQASTGHRHGCRARDQVRRADRDVPAGRRTGRCARDVPRHDPHQHVPHRARPLLRRGHPAAPRSAATPRGRGPDPTTSPTSPTGSTPSPPDPRPGVCHAGADPPSSRTRIIPAR